MGKGTDEYTFTAFPVPHSEDVVYVYQRRDNERRDVAISNLKITPNNL